MPDAVTNAEVEDVLSSIRRLVSEDRRVPAEEKPKAKTDRLVLTPALRVAEAPRHKENEGAARAADSAEEQDGFDDHRSQEDTDADAVIDALMAQEHGAQEDAASEMAVNDEAGVDLDGEADADREVSEDHAAAAGTEDSEETAQADHDAGLTDGRTLHEVFRAVDAQEAEAAALRDVPEYRGPSTAAMNAQSLSAKIAVLEEVIARTDDQWEPDGAGRDDYAGTEPPAMAWEDAAEDAESEDAADTAPEATLFAGQGARRDTSADSLNTDEDILDEDALRDLVSDIVRQELQGALGERITRNVRKLVRREIHRALAAQELE
ncbi:hypothetical protein [Pseudosulfitobacter pseudonitzschiae]|uniref:hypothetical protein n=1 Tax=Pseudosulfitobacter pseudonitzschiae TaxID=1402135 RepID=UPI001AFBA0F0|nr:hypothetical protein [Pseudosulfitobacter pseudonitzschiae]MBM1815222.1 hypothetical protein [Pseudosulfitobacter pseudonitzschiae]MBM1832213.1 hypothetical protein [Pseudosulfitobacter pseudonitzschiae]MBM1837081.1 hypothetical protein [Pseudosulfitobacter pseudonitzschiae]MBM1841927.1 hypothetical protein [Pseudosulfitobacter pseudonitzschiae]MBM1846795.1 hypothetical protein [Pseudosulfitobacter pseudonitzschiae]